MGSGSYSSATYAATRSAKAASGIPTFAHTHTMRSSTPASGWAAHTDLDPKDLATRESRDSDEHPTSFPTAIFFDVTGSMIDVPQTLQTKLNEVYGLLLRRGYVEHPQVLVGAIGDVLSDRVPFQIGQFESDNRVDDQLSNIFLEGNGGGQHPPSESYELALYALARCTVTDSMEKRGEKGVAFLIGDERARDLTPSAALKVFNHEIPETIPLATLLAEAQEKWEIYFIVPQDTYHGNEPELIAYWRDLFGQRLIQVDTGENIAETIAVTVGLERGAIDSVDDALEDLDAVGAGGAKGTVSKALAHVGGGGGAVATSEDLDGLDGAGTERI